MITNDNISYCSDGSSDTTDDETSTISASSSKEENLNDLVLSKEANQGKLAFGNIAVVNSSNVHFGNKTVYEGPVTIKQFLYAKQQTISDLNNGHNKFSDDNKSCVPDSVNSNNNINLGFHPPGATISNKNNSNCISNSPQSAIIKKDLKWFRNILRQHLPLMLSLSGLLLLSLIVLMSVLLTRHRTVVYPFDTNEQDQNSPAYADSWSIKSFWKKHIKLLVMAVVILILLIISIACAVIFTYNDILNKDDTLPIISRVKWLAQPVKGLVPLLLPVGYVIISETQTENCESQGRCVLIVRDRQSYDIDSNNRTDIGYNFLIGGDGNVYEGRGWNLQGAHTFGYNSRSIGIAFIGTFSNNLPFQNQIQVTKKLIDEGLKLGYIVSNYKLFTNKQLEVTQNPGELLHNKITTWSHWQKLQ